ncbi:alkyl hydroperoxide reductase [Elizabethkingia sp. HX XZB]|uniref:alkyl hydroperoxide reductase n=1 Tax=Elizabethkingia sp. HX XZB TaxID=3003193 RepID=UPI002A24D591|nr:alkyl hydroperoxide reductase [Elizabethkingia sp. HX XZB]MDX8569360.1 alkyl hydroperoxide reductase [Elizabethkingia sp. HX XZB]
MNKISIILSLLFFYFLGFYKAQKIEMYFPYFAGKTYEFIIFQGSQSLTVLTDTIPKDGKFSLTIPQEYAPYKGMSRWLITGTKEGGGLDMYIPGNDFSVSCKESKPSNKNIIYTNNTGNNNLNELYQKQEIIFQRYDAMLRAIKAFDKTDKNYSVFKYELREQQNEYKVFQNALKTKYDYLGQFIQIVNITRGKGNKLLEKENDRAENITNYIANELDWQTLYTSGHWSSIISSWVSIHTQVLKDPKKFTIEYRKINSIIKTPDLRMDFSEKVRYYLTQQKQDIYLKIIK